MTTPRSRLICVAFAACLPLYLAAHAEDRIRPVRRVVPDYPADAMEKEVPGRVSAWLVVDRHGDVTDVEIITESPASFGFADAAREAFLEWTYPPNVAGRYKATITFALEPLELTPEEAKLPLAAPPISMTRGRYPSKAIDANVTGEAKVVAIIGESGTVESVRIVSESPPGFGFGFATRDAVSLYKFRPGPRAVWMTTMKYPFYDDGRVEIALPSGDLPAAPEPRRAGTPEYPHRAWREKVEGWVELGIQIDKRGRITHGAVLAEQPAGYGFGASAYKALGEWRYSGVAPGTYKLKVEFRLGDD